MAAPKKERRSYEREICLRIGNARGTEHVTGRHVIATATESGVKSIMFSGLYLFRCSTIWNCTLAIVRDSELIQRTANSLLLRVSEKSQKSLLDQYFNGFLSR